MANNSYNLERPIACILKIKVWGCHLQAAMTRRTSPRLSANEVISSSKHPGHTGSPLNSERLPASLPHLAHFSDSLCRLFDFTMKFCVSMSYISLSVALRTTYILLLFDYRGQLKIRVTTAFSKLRPLDFVAFFSKYTYYFSEFIH